MTDVPRPGTTASVEARVERLEGQVNALMTDVALIRQAQGNLTALVTTQHTSLFSQLTALSMDFRAFSASVTAQNSEPSGTPAGRAILAAFASRDADIAEAKKTADAALLWTIRASAILGAGMALLTIIAPLIRTALGLPQA